tara:strand:+ start:1714 stop:1875 length:162 start_codon:yes stop_codon:yes gene_type:complete
MSQSEFKAWLEEPSGFGNFSRWELIEDNYLNMRLKDWKEELYEAFEAGLQYDT